MLSAREFEEWFSPNLDEVSWVCAKIMTGEFRLMLLVLLKCYQWLGYFPRLAGVPPDVVEHVRDRALEMSGQRIGPWGTSESERMLKRCRELVRDRLHLSVVFGLDEKTRSATPQRHGNSCKPKSSTTLRVDANPRVQP